MKKLKIMSVFGVRPEAVKMAPVIKELQRYPEVIESIVTVTGQHREMLDQVLQLYGIKTDYDLNIMKSRQTLTDIIERSLRGLEEVYMNVKPDMVLVHGDPSTSFIAALAAFYQKIPIGHVEAGLRTYDKYFPFPEEMNRRLTGVLADLHFAPTESTRQNLLREGIANDKIYVTGNTAIDALKHTVRQNFSYRTPALVSKPWESGRLLLMEVHRRENWGQPIKDICEGVKQLVQLFENLTLVFPVHLNPIVRDTVFEVLGKQDRIILVDPLDADEYHNLIAEATLLISDSGGVQEEAPALGTPVLVTRNVTERPEAVEVGTVKVIGTAKDSVIREASRLLNNEQERLAMAHKVNPYGDGRAATRIVAAILFYFGYTTDVPPQWKYKTE